MRKTKRAGKLSRRYARALHSAIERAVAQGTLSAAATDGLSIAQQFASRLSAFAATFTADAQLAPYCLSPLYPKAQRQAAFLAVAQACGVTGIAYDFLRMMFEHDRAPALPEVAEAFSALADRAAGVVKVELIAARELSDHDRAEAEGRVRAAVGGLPQFFWHVDSDLIGGIVVKYAGKILDGSVKGRLEQIEKQLGI